MVFDSKGIDDNAELIEIAHALISLKKCFETLVQLTK